MLLNLIKVSSIQPAPGARFLAVLRSGEEVLISRKYVPGFDAVKKDWAESGFLIRNAAGRFNCNCPKGMTGTFVKPHLRE